VPGPYPKSVSTSTPTSAQSQTPGKTRALGIQIGIGLLAYIQGKLVLRRRLLVGGRGVVRHSLFFIDAQIARVRANKPFIEDAAWKKIEVFVFQSFQMPPGNLGGFRDFLQSDTPHFPFAPQPFAK